MKRPTTSHQHVSETQTSSLMFCRFVCDVDDYSPQQVGNLLAYAEVVLMEFGLNVLQFVVIVMSNER